MFWLKLPGIGAGAPGTAGGCVGPNARDAGWSKSIARVYEVTRVMPDGAHGRAMFRLCPKLAFCAVPEYVIEATVPAPIAREALAIVVAASCPAALAGSSAIVTAMMHAERRYVLLIV
jgi:hypothetical protein